MAVVVGRRGVLVADEVASGAVGASRTVDSGTRVRRTDSYGQHSFRTSGPGQRIHLRPGPGFPPKLSPGMRSMGACAKTCRCKPEHRQGAKGGAPVSKQLAARQAWDRRGPWERRGPYRSAGLMWDHLDRYGVDVGRLWVGCGSAVGRLWGYPDRFPPRRLVVA